MFSREFSDFGNFIDPAPSLTTEDSTEVTVRIARVKSLPTILIKGFKGIDERPPVMTVKATKMIMSKASDSSICMTIVYC